MVSRQSNPIIVQSGDTLSDLGAKYGFDYHSAQIIRNGKTYSIGHGSSDINPRNIYPGDQVIPNGKEAIDASPSYVDVANEAGEEAGTGSADSVIQGCDLLRIGVFFDGTGNSRDYVSTGSISWHTNVDLLEHQYDEMDAPEVREINGENREVLNFPIYMRGIGVQADGGTTMHGMGWGTGDEGVENRVLQARDEVLENIQIRANGMEPCDVWFDTFGFSRGAAAARDFANNVKNKNITYGSSRMKVKFMGLFDTVSSLGKGGHTGNIDGVDIGTMGTAETIVHITAKDELRKYFPLTLADADKETRIEVVGAHSDIGGGYELNDNVSKFTYDTADYPGLRSSYEARWGVKNNFSTPSDNDTVTTTGNTRYWDNRETILHTTSKHGIQFVTLRLMHDLAKDADVPFTDIIGDNIAGTSVAMDGNLSSYYEELKAKPYTASQVTEEKIRREYAHFSVNNKSIWGVHPNYPEPNGRRRIVSM